MSKKLFIYSFPGDIGGADTKLDHTLPLFKELFDEVMCVANAPITFTPANRWTRYLDDLGITYGLKEDMKDYKEGDIALSLCNPYFFSQGFCDDAKSKGLKVIWSSEMMWHHEKELEYIEKNMVDKILYVSDIQKQELIYPENLQTAMTGNYINPDRFPFKKRTYNGLSIGRLSRDDTYKYSENFPLIYENMVQNLDPNRIRFQVMAWNNELEEKYSWYDFSKNNWNFYQASNMPSITFLQNIDIFAYPLGHNFVESWGRSTVEAMLTGAIPILQPGHHTDNLVISGDSGFIIEDPYDWKHVTKELFFNLELRYKMSSRVAEYAREVHCNKQEHLKMWEDALLK